MAKLKLIGIAGIILLFLYYQFIGLIKENSKLEADNSGLLEAAKLLGEDSVRKSKINVERDKTIAKINNDNQVLKNDLSKLQTTPKQAECDLVVTPSGYVDRMLKRTN